MLLKATFCNEVSGPVDDTVCTANFEILNFCWTISNYSSLIHFASPNGLGGELSHESWSSPSIINSMEVKNATTVYTYRRLILLSCLLEETAFKLTNKSRIGDRLSQALAG